MMMINRRRVCGGKKLPYDAEIEYLESSGTQYIDTDVFVTNANFEIYIKIFHQNVPNSEEDICGNNKRTGGRFVLGIYNRQIFGQSRSGQEDANVTSRHYPGAQLFEIKLEYDYDNRTKTLNVNGETFSKTYTANISNSVCPVTLFTDGQFRQYMFRGRIYIVKMYQNGNLVLDLIPVRIGTTGYMYDKVSGQLFGNAGTGDFILGADK